MKLLHLVIAESALETVPDEIANHPVIVREAKRRNVEPKYIILDRSKHHIAMKSLNKSHKRGRPDIVYLTLQVTQYTPLNIKGLLRTYVHTINNKVLVINPETRIPHNYNNFIGLIEQLFKIGRVPPHGKPLIVLKEMSIKDLINTIRPTSTILLDDIKGIESTFKDVVKLIIREEEPCVIIGGFPHGEFEPDTYSIADQVVKIGKFNYTTQLITCKLLTYLERELGIEY